MGLEQGLGLGLVQGLGQGLGCDWGWGWHLGEGWAGIWAEAGAEVDWDGIRAGTGTGGACGTPWQSSPCPSLPQGSPPVRGRFRCPVAPHQPRPRGAALGAPGPRCPCPALPTQALVWPTAPAGACAVAPSTPSPWPLMGPEPPAVGLGGQPAIGASGREEVGRQRPCPAASSPARCILPAHPFPAGRHTGARTGQGHQHRTGSTAAAILLHPAAILLHPAASPSTPGQRGSVLPHCRAWGVSRRCRQGQVATGRAY